MGKRLLLLLALTAPALLAAKTLDIYFIDVDHGNAVLLVSPSGESMMFDTGQPGDKYVNRILAAFEKAGLKKLDYVVVSHYDWDHYGTVPALAGKIPILNYVDHGLSIREVQTEEERARDSGGRPNDKPYMDYCKAREKGKHLAVKPGDRIPISGLDVRVLASGGETLLEPLPGAGGSNPGCAATQARVDVAVEDAWSVCKLVTFGKFKFADFGDLTWNKSCRLFCPRNMVGQVDAYVITHHGISMDPHAAGVYEWGVSSAPPAEVLGLHPRVAFLLAGEDLVGRVSLPEAWQRTRKSPGLEDIWQIHYVAQAGKQNNAPEQFIANPSLVNDQAHYIKLSAEPDGSFTVTNTRNAFTKRYAARTEVKQ